MATITQQPSTQASLTKPATTVLLTAVAYFMVALDGLVVVTALPSIHRSFGGGVATLQWTVNAYTITFGAGILTAAALGDRRAEVADLFTERLLAHVAELRVGDPTKAGVTVGPLARSDLRDALARQVRESVEQGARVLAGGRAPDLPGSTTSRRCSTVSRRGCRC